MAKSKAQQASDFLGELMEKDGWWKCEVCSVPNWEVHHRKDEACPKSAEKATQDFCPRCDGRGGWDVQGDGEIAWPEWKECPDCGQGEVL